MHMPLGEQYLVAWVIGTCVGIEISNSSGKATLGCSSRQVDEDRFDKKWEILMIDTLSNEA